MEIGSLIRSALFNTAIDAVKTWARGFKFQAWFLSNYDYPSQILPCDSCSCVSTCTLYHFVMSVLYNAISIAWHFPWKGMERCSMAVATTYDTPWRQGHEPELPWRPGASRGVVSWQIAAVYGIGHGRFPRFASFFIGKYGKTMKQHQSWQENQPQSW